MSTALATRPTGASSMTPSQALAHRLGSAALANQIAAALPDQRKLERFCRTALTVCSTDPTLLDENKTNRQSLGLALIQIATMGLEVGPLGEAYVVRYGSDAKPLVGYKGLLKLARQSGEIEDISATVVYAGDDFSYTAGTSPNVHHVPNLQGPRGDADIVAVYAVAWLRGSPRPHVEVMTVQEVNAVRRASRSGGSGPWKDWYGEMARKTVIRRIIKQLPVSIEFAEALDDAPAATPQPQTVDVTGQPSRPMAISDAGTVPPPPPGETTYQLDPAPSAREPGQEG